MKLKQWIRIGIFACMLVIGLAYISVVFENKSPDAVSKEFGKNTGKNYDVIFLGPSTMKNDIYPLELYTDYGIVAYNLACGSQSIVESYYLAKSAIEKYRPSLIVLDVFMIPYEGAYLTEGQLHFVTDAMSGADKWEIIKELVPKESREQYLFELSIYHERWKELSAEDFMGPEDIAYGAKLNTTSKPIKEYTVTTEKKEIPECNNEYLAKIVTLCKQEQVELLLVNLPIDFEARHGVLGDMKKVQMLYNSLEDFAEENQIAYWNYMTCPESIELDLEKDYDGGFHLNIFGAEKLTKYMGKYILDNYDVPDRRMDKNYDFIRDDYILYEKYKEEQKMILSK